MHPPGYIEFIEAESRAEAQRRQPLRVLLIFLAVFFSLQYAWEMSRDSWVERLFNQCCARSHANLQRGVGQRRRQ